MSKQIGALEGFGSIVYTRTCDVIVTPMCNCLCTWQPRRIVWQPIHDRSACQRPLRIAYLNLDLDLAPSTITVVTNMDVGSLVKCLCTYTHTNAGNNNTW